jgi:hypothetical protein
MIKAENTSVVLFLHVVPQNGKSRTTLASSSLGRELFLQRFRFVPGPPLPAPTRA